MTLKEACQKLVILLWKHFTVRCRRYINTAIEFIVPSIVYKLVWDMEALILAPYMSLLVVFEFLMSRLIDERASGIQEHIKMVGVTTKMLGMSHFFNVLPGAIIFSLVGTIVVNLLPNSPCQYSNGFLIWLFLMLHYLSIVALAFACSYILNNAQHSTVLANFIYIAAIFSSVMLNVLEIPAWLVPLDGLLPFVPGHWFSSEVQELESKKIGVTFSTMTSAHKIQRGSALLALIFLLLQIVVFFGLAWYLSLVRPGKYGTALPWNFFLRREFWNKGKKDVQSDPEADAENQEERYLLTEEKYFEPLPNGSEVGIKIENVSKIFGDYHALNNMTLSVLKGEITVLLGHNGAGKTTLMSIITGMTSATRGKVYINGLDTLTQQSEVRNQLGFCPQHNLFFNELTVLEHVVFFSWLKGTRPYSAAKKSSLELLNHLGLDQKAGSLSSELSGGMKRRLQLACALAGDASVLVLDEPTSGLDVETRRGLWDLLLTLRAGRTVLLSTHFMEEADALGDRVAALHSGTLRCYATPMHLKKEIDTGYRLTIGLTPDTSRTEAERNISRIIMSILPITTQLPESGVQTLAYKLPSKQSGKFPALFKELEDNMDKWGIESIGVGVSTLEEVFLKLCSDVSVVAPGDEVGASLLDDSATSHRITGIHKVARQIIALLARQIRYVMSSWKSFVVMQAILPILVLLAITYTSKDSYYPYYREHNPMSDMSIKLWGTFTAFVIQVTLSNAVVLPSKERLASTRHVHTMFGCNPELYWLTTLLYHLTYGVVVLIIPAIVFAVTLDEGYVLSSGDTLPVLVLVLLLGSLAFLSMTYLFSFIFSSYKIAASTIVALVFVFSLIIGPLSPTLQIECVYLQTLNKSSGINDYENSICDYVPLIRVAAYTIMPVTFVEAILRSLKVGQLNAYCTLNKHGCPNPKVHEFGFDKETCCVLNELPRCYFCFDTFSPAPQIVALFIQVLFFMTLVFLAERGIFSEVYNRLVNSKYKPEPYLKDEILEEEQKYVEEALRQPQGDALLVSSVHKRYPAFICGKSMTAVRDISFAIREGECFGLVGVNGAGKSSTFKMMTCETLPTLGQIVANGQQQRLFDNAEFLNGMGYCAQFATLDDFLTGRQNLELLLTLDGLTSEGAKKEAAAWLELIDLMKYADKPLSTYSGGCSRRLCSVAALARRAALSLLDEPTAGVDVAARRQLWRCVRAAQAHTTRAGRRRAVLITSHSMDEMEALCSRVAIMSAGRLATLGSPAALRAAHKAGFALSIKIKDTSGSRQRPDPDIGETDNTTTSMNPDLQRLKQSCLNFQWTLKDEYKTMLNYHVGKELRMKYSELFTKLEELRENFPALVEDYAVTETTLEQVFLSFAKTETAVV